MKKAAKIINFSKENARYIFVFLAIILIILINKSFPAQVITSESCAGGKCKTILQNPNLTDKNPLLYINDIFESDANGYYRLVFQTEADQDSEIAVVATNPVDERKELKIINVKKLKNDSFQEILFSTDKKYSDILFEKKNKTDGAEISIIGIQISRLNVSSEKELLGFQPTIRGEVDLDVPDQSQTDNSKYFDQLRDPNIIFGQIFKPQVDYITGVSLDMDIVKQSNNGGKKYKLDLRDVDYTEGSVLEIKSNAIYDLSFTINDLEKYRQEDGKFKFPLFARLDPEKYYFIGINNDKIGVNKYNYLRLKGTSDGEKYKNGIVAIKTKGQSYSTTGDLYFETYGIRFGEYNGKKILRGSTIEDIGKGKGIFKYQPRNDSYDLVDTESYSSDVNFDDNKMVLSGSADPNDNSEFIYKFETIFPFNKFRIFARQADIGWSKVSVSYSYDEKNWKEIPATEASEISSSGYSIQKTQVFDYEIQENIPKDSVYIKISPQNPAPEEKEYGVSNLRIEADLLIK
ncbi:MAG: hypothetical protein WCV59_00840 [Parcubacteria group bacterium]